MTFDKRITPARADIAARHLTGKVAAKQFVDGHEKTVVAGVAPLRGAPDESAGLETQLIYGERFTVYEERGGWAWGQAASDSYVGYVPAGALASGASAPTHVVTALRTFLYPEANLKRPTRDTLTLGAAVAIEGEEGGYFRVAGGGWLSSAHVAPLPATAHDFVAVAERFMGTPYLWGGKTAMGLDCSGLVQTALMRADIAAPRDTDMQEKALGRALDEAESKELRRGDLVFWKGHVGILTDAATLLHANAFHMAVALEPLRYAIERIAKAGQPVTSIRRL